MFPALRRAAILAPLLLACWPAAAQQDWPERRCAAYRAAWADALAQFGAAGVGAEFVARHEAFLARGCRPPREVCPRTREEEALADALTVAAMNAGAASSFLPFACRG